MVTMPEKKREIRNHHMDSSFWNGFTYRPDDVVIASYIKSGTTWLQQIVGQLIFDGNEGLPVARMSPWLDLRFPPKQEKLAFLEAQEHRRFIKTHLPADALVLSEKAKYLYIARDGRDVVWSMHWHYTRGNDLMYQALNKTPGRVGPPMPKPPESVVQYFTEWLDGDGYPIWSFWDNIRSWWKLRDFPNIKLLHYNNLKEDLKGKIIDIADFLEIPIHDNNMLENIYHHCSFDYMKEHAELMVPLEGKLWSGGAKTFIHKGTNKRWSDELPHSESARYEQVAKEMLGENCAAWLKTGNVRYLG